MDKAKAMLILEAYANDTRALYGKTATAHEMIIAKGKELGISVVTVDCDEQMSIATPFINPKGTVEGEQKPAAGLTNNINQDEYECVIIDAPPSNGPMTTSNIKTKD